MGKRKEEDKGNNGYNYVRKDGYVHVIGTRTAPGQKLSVGIFNIASRTWTKDKLLPNKIKKEVEERYRP